MTSMMFAPFDPDPECPWCNGRGFKHIVDDQVDVVGRCDCTNWSTYAELRRLKGLTMKQALEAAKQYGSGLSWPSRAKREQ
jgi:hypothetical protein